MSHILKSKNYVLFIILIALAACSPQIIYQSTWQSKPVVADGIANEWKIPLRFYDPDTKLNYTVTNDNENLYLCMRASNEATQVKIMRAGLQIWIDTAAKHSKSIGIMYPMAGVTKKGSGQRNNEGNYSGSSSSGDMPSSKAVHAMFLSQANNMQITGFKPPIGGITPRSNNYGIYIGMNWDSSDILIYEAVIPLKTFCSHPLDTTKTFALGIYLNALPEPNSGGGHGGGGSHGGGGGMGGGSHGGGHGTTINGVSSEDYKAGLYDNQSFWINFHLAHK